MPSESKNDGVIPHMAQTRQVRKADPITQVGFTLEDAEATFLTASAVNSGQATLKNILPRDHSRYSEFFTISGTDPDAVTALSEAGHSTEISLHSRRDRSALFEFVVGTDCPIITLCHLGAIPYRVEAVAGEGSIDVAIPPAEDAATITDAFLAAHPAAELTSKHEHASNTLLFSAVEIERAIASLLTDRQWEILSVAHESGYYDWPREINGESIARELDISSATFHEHLRSAEQKIMGLVFERE